MLIIRQQAAPAYWRGAAVVCIDAYPAVLSAPVWREVMGHCSYDGVSAEMTLSSERAGLRLWLILHTEAQEEARLEEKLSPLARRIVLALQNAGFTAHAAQSEKECPPGAESGGPSVIFVPAETAGDVYIPAAWERVEPVGLERIAQTLSSHPGSRWSLSLLQAALTPEELDCIRQNIHFFSGWNRNDLAAAAYAALESQAGKPMYFAFMHASGDGDALHELTRLHEACGLARRWVPAVNADTPEKLLSAPLAMAEQVSAGGHTSPAAQQLSSGMRRLSFLMAAEQAESAVAFPQEGERMHGMKLSRMAVDRLPLPEKMREESGLLLGWRNGADEAVRLPPRQLTKHAVVVGMPGSGKTQFSLGMLIELHKHGYPFLAIEPTKTEYRALMDVIPELRVYTPGRSDVAPMALNPFVPPRGISLEEFLPSLTTVFTAAFSMPTPLDTIFADVLRACYARHGWRSSSTVDDPNAKVFGLHEFICMFRETIQRSDYSAESKQNLLSGGVYRLQALINSNPTLFDTTDALPYDTLLEQPTLIELDAIDNAQQKSLIMAILLANMMLVVRHRQVCDGELKNVLMIDEAHLLLGQGGSVRADGAADPRGATVQLLQDITVAIRAYGTGIIFADQSPEKLTHEVVDNANIKIIFRLDSTEQRMMIGGSVGLEREDIDAIRSQKPGEAYCHCNLLDRPVRIRTVNTSVVYKLRDRVEPEEVSARMVGENRLRPPYSECTGCTACSPAVRAEADYLARYICDENLSIISSRDSLLRFLSMGMKLQVKKAVEKRSADGFDRELLSECVRAHLLRRIMLTCPADVTVKEIMNAVSKGAQETR